MLEYFHALGDEQAPAEALAVKAASDGTIMAHAEVAARFGMAPNGQPL